MIGHWTLLTKLNLWVPSPTQRQGQGGNQKFQPSKQGQPLPGNDLSAHQKDTPTTQEIPRVLGALYQEPETKTKYIYFLLYNTPQPPLFLRATLGLIFSTLCTNEVIFFEKRFATLFSRLLLCPGEISEPWLWSLQYLFHVMTAYLQIILYDSVDNGRNL